MDKLNSIKSLICAATIRELKCWPGSWIQNLVEEIEYISFENNGYLLLEAGVPYAIKNLMINLYENTPKKIINLGIAGAYPQSGLNIGDIVLGISECFGDLGIELKQEPFFKSISNFDFGVHNKEFLLEVPEPLNNSEEFNIQTGKGNTVNTVTGSQKTGNLREFATKAKFETMEGAAVAMVGDYLRIPVIEIRAISNIASDRNINEKGISLALSNLTKYLQNNEKQFI